MNRATAFDDALDAAIDALQRGRPLDAVIADQGHRGALLRPLLEVADATRRSVTSAPSSPNLEHNYAIVRAAVERAHMTAAAASRERVPQAPSWWRRRLGFASLSLPAGVVALALTAGAVGAAASLVALDPGAVVGELVRPVLPDAITRDEDESATTPPNERGGGAPVDVPGADHQPTDITLEGTVTDVKGNIFTLTAGDDAYLIQIDANTEIEGEILEGATAAVSGEMTGEKNVHATRVSAQGGTPADPSGKPDGAGQPVEPGRPEDPGQQGEPPGSERPPEAPPAQGEELPGSRGEGGSTKANEADGDASDGGIAGA